MTNKFTLGIEISADPAKARAGLAAHRKDLLDTYSDARQAVVKYNEVLTQAQEKATAMGRNMGAMGPPTKAMVADFEKVRASVNSAKDAVEKKTLALQQARQAVRENAEAIAAASRAEQSWAAATAARNAAAAPQTRNASISAAMGSVGGRGDAAIRTDIAEAQRAVASLKSSGAAAGEIARASQLAQTRIAALTAELNGTVPAGAAAQGSMAGVAHRMAAMAAAAIAAREAVQLLKTSVETGIKFDSLKTQYAFGNGGDVKKAADEMAYASKLSNRLGLELLSTTQAYGKLQAASRGTSLSGEKTRDIFTAVASAGAVMGLSAEEQSGALLALSQMMSKGTVSSEELRGQLGERLPVAFAIAAKAMNVTEGELQKMLEAGQLSAEQFLPRFAAALQASVNSALPAAEASARANLQRLENAFTDFKLRIANSGLLDKVAEQLERLLAHIGNMADSGELDKLATGFANAFGAAIKFMADAAIFAERFAGVLGPLATGLAAVMVGGRALSLLGAGAPALAATATAATAAAAGVGLLAGALRLLKSLTIGGIILMGAEALIEWGAKASEARAQAEALDAEIKRLIDTNNEHASKTRLDADSLAEFGDEAMAAYEKAIKGARDYAAAKVVDLTKSNKDGRNDEAIAFYRDQAGAYNEYIDTVLEGEKLRREAARLTGQILAKEAEREKLLAGEVKKTRAEAIAEEIKGYEKLVEAIQKAREESKKEAEDATKKAADLRDKAKDQKTSAADKATQIREKDLTPEERQANDQARAQEAQSEGSYYAAAAAAAQLDGRGKDFEKYSKQAEKFLERAMKFAESAQDANLVEDIGKEQSKLSESGAKAEDKKAADATQQAAALMEQLNTAQAKVAELKGEAAAIAINADISGLVAKLAEAQSNLADLKDKTVTVTMNTVTTGAAAPAVPAGQNPYDALPAYAYGGELPGSAPHDRADNRLYWGTPGEWVIQRPAVRHYGAAWIAAVNAMKLPKYAFGGEIGGSTIRNLSIPQISQPAKGTGGNTPLVLDFGKFGRVNAEARRDSADEILRVFDRARMQFGRRP